MWLQRSFSDYTYDAQGVGDEASSVSVSSWLNQLEKEYSIQRVLIVPSKGREVHYLVEVEEKQRGDVYIEDATRVVSNAGGVGWSSRGVAVYAGIVDD